MAEILAPAGNEQTARSALYAGADAVYLGLNEFSARGSAENFSLQALERTVALAHILGAKVYVCLNTLIKDVETERFFSCAVKAWNLGADAILMQDIFLGKRLKETYPEIRLHLSTQAGACNVWGARLAKEYGFSRVVLARETPLEEIAKISAVVETEAFVQGALCSCFSGQCYFSSFAGNNSGNRGRCKQPCRKKYEIDRKGYETPAYALSLSDLSVGERVEELIGAGVSSLKIEGRLRRPEYVTAAVRYYRVLLAGGRGESEFSRLKRAFNRGDYTNGLAFGQKKDFLSRKVQGHVGETIGAIALRGGKYYCQGSARKGDAFKILRNGFEVGGAIFDCAEKGGFYLVSHEKLCAGDEVRITSDSAPYQETERTRKMALSLYFRAGEKPVVICGKLVFTGEETLQKAKSAPLTREELINCFCKTDGLPFEIAFEEIQTDGVFLPKSALNAFRRTFYAALVADLAPARSNLIEKRVETAIQTEQEEKTAVIATDLTGIKADILILKPRDYSLVNENSAPKGVGETFLYLPPFLTSQEEKVVRNAARYFDGIYCEGFYGLALAEKYGKKLFAGTGFNLTNRFAVSEVRKAGAHYIALSKEIDGKEQRALAVKNAFALCLGGVKLMDLCYCPFEKTCASCDKREFYTMTDEAGRRFPLRRYLIGGECRFEVYNCVPLAADRGRTGALIDCTVETNPASSEFFRKDGAENRGNYTKGHFERSML